MHLIPIFRKVSDTLLGSMLISVGHEKNIFNGVIKVILFKGKSSLSVLRAVKNHLSGNVGKFKTKAEYIKV